MVAAQARYAFAAREVFVSTIGMVYGLGEVGDDDAPLRERMRSEMNRDGRPAHTPLVGLSTHARYLHDGRAADLRAAIFDHGGEAAVVRERFFELEPAEQAQVYAFLRTL